MKSWIKLPIHGGATVIDLESLPLFRTRKWHLGDTGYAVWRGKIDGVKQTIRLHRLLAGTSADMVTDHLNHNRLDNRNHNLRICDQKSNNSNRPSDDKGYCWDTSKNKWLVVHKSQFYGRYLTEDEAKKAIQLARSGVEYVKTRRKLYYLPLGITKQHGKYRSRPQRDGIRYWLGEFETLEQAQSALNNFNNERGIKQSQELYLEAN